MKRRLALGISGVAAAATASAFLLGALLRDDGDAHSADDHAVAFGDEPATPATAIVGLVGGKPASPGMGQGHAPGEAAALVGEPGAEGLGAATAGLAPDGSVAPTAEGAAAPPTAAIVLPDSVPNSVANSARVDGGAASGAPGASSAARDEAARRGAAAQGAHAKVSRVAGAVADGGVAPVSTAVGAALSAAGADRPGGRRAGSPDGGVATIRPDAGVLMLARLLESRPSSDRSNEESSDFVRVPRFAATGGASLEGRVVDADTGRGIPGVVVEARLARRLVEASTEGSGAFRMAGMLPGTHVVVWVGGRRDQFVSERIEVRVPGEGQVAETGVIRLLRGDELASNRDGWVGLFVAPRGGKVAVSAVTPWLPADRAGVEVGDVLVSIDGRDVSGLGSRAVTFLLRGGVGSRVSLVAEPKDGGSRRTLALERVVR